MRILRSEVRRGWQPPVPRVFAFGETIVQDDVVSLVDPVAEAGTHEVFGAVLVSDVVVVSQNVVAIEDADVALPAEQPIDGGLCHVAQVGSIRPVGADDVARLGRLPALREVGLRRILRAQDVVPQPEGELRGGVVTESKGAVDAPVVLLGLVGVPVITEVAREIGAEGGIVDGKPDAGAKGGDPVGLLVFPCKVDVARVLLRGENVWLDLVTLPGGQAGRPGRAGRSGRSGCVGLTGRVSYQAQAKTTESPLHQ